MPGLLLLRGVDAPSKPAAVAVALSLTRSFGPIRGQRALASARAGARKHGPWSVAIQYERPADAVTAHRVLTEYSHLVRQRAGGACAVQRF